MTTDRVMAVDMSTARTRLQRCSLSALMILLGVSTSLTFAADAMSQSADFDIPPQSIESALHEFSRQADVQVMVTPPSVEGQRTSGVKGRLSAANALTQLLQNTDLTYETIGGGNTVTVKRVAAATRAEPTETAPEQTRLQEEDDSTDTENRPTPSSDARESDNDRRLRGSLEEVIVTAQKREERLQDVPISITVLSGYDLDKSTVQGVTEALNRVPGVAATVAVQGGGTQLAVRGVSAASPLFSGSSAIAYYLDAVPFGLVKTAIAPDAKAYDLERVEVLRGPQGTLYGASALNGVVRVLTKDANLNKFELKARSSVSTTAYGGENYGADMAVNLPLVTDKLAARAVLGYERLDGWIDKANRKDANDAELLNTRLKVNAQPTEQLSIGLSAWLSRSDYGAPSFSPDNRRYPALLNEPIATDYDAYGLKIGYEFSGFSLNSMTSYLDYSSDSFLDQAPGGLRGITRAETLFEAETLSQEVNLTSTHEGSWRWSLGGIYRDGEDRIVSRWPGVIVAPVDQSYRSESFAVFGELTRLSLDGQLGLTAGLRYFEDDLTEREDSRLTGAPPAGVYAQHKFDDLSPRLVLSWYPRSQITLYVSYAEGFRSGSAQAPTVLAAFPSLPPVDPDNLKNYEVGTKGSLWGGRLNFDTALFYIDWRGVQQSLLVPVNNVRVTTLVNSESASGMGFEFAVTAEPVDGLTLGANFNWNDLKFDADVLSSGIVLFSKGSRLNFSPEYTVGASADYVFPLGGDGYEGRLAASVNYTAKQVSRRFASGAIQTSAGDPMMIGRTSFSIDSPDHRWTATLFVDNVNNEQHAFINDWLGVSDRDLRIRPRTIGVQFEFRP